MEDRRKDDMREGMVEKRIDKNKSVRERTEEGREGGRKGRPTTRTKDGVPRNVEEGGVRIDRAVAGGPERVDHGLHALLVDVVALREEQEGDQNRGMGMNQLRSIYPVFMLHDASACRSHCYLFFIDHGNPIEVESLPFPHSPPPGLSPYLVPPRSGVGKDCPRCPS